MQKETEKEKGAEDTGHKAISEKGDLDPTTVTTASGERTLNKHHKESEFGLKFYDSKSNRRMEKVDETPVMNPARS